MSDKNEYFSKEEFACKCGCGFNSVSADLLSILVTLRAVLNEPVFIVSACRCATHNALVGGVEHSQHLLGKAADIRVGSLSPRRLANFIERSNIKVGGLGIYSTFIHVDTRQGHARWAK